MKLSDLKGKPVVTMQEATRVGTVDDIVMDSNRQQIEAMRIKPEGRGPEYATAHQHICSIGPDVVTIDNQDALQVPDDMPELANLPSLSSIVHSRVVTEGGELLGTITDVDFDPITYRILAFEYETSAIAGLFGRRQHLDPKDIVGIGENLVTVREEVRPPRAA